MYVASIFPKGLGAVRPLIPLFNVAIMGRRPIIESTAVRSTAVVGAVRPRR